MIVFVDNENRIKAVNTTHDHSLTPLEINDNNNPFNGWSTAKICCYKVTVQDGFVTMMTPYVPSSNLEGFDNTGKQVDANTEGVSENDTAVCDVAEMADVNSQAIDDLAEYIDALEQRIEALEGGE